MKLLKLLLITLFLLFAESASYNEFSQDYNHPKIKWYTLETEHYKIHFMEGMQYKAEEVGNIAERLYRIFRYHYQFVLPQKTDLIVNDADFPGGWTSPILNIVSIDIHNFDFNMRGTHHWLNDVITHELAHLFSIRTSFKLPYWMPDIRIGYFDYPNEKFQSSAFHVISTDILPQWFAEGIAQHQSSMEGSDRWDTHRDMILRVATLENKLLSYDEMCVFSGIYLNLEGAYNQGFSMVNYITEKYGESAIVSMLRDATLFYRHDFKPVIKNVLGITSDQLYGEWKGSIKERFATQISSIGKQVYGKKITDNGFFTDFPRWAPDGKRIYFLSNKNQDYGIQSLYQYDFSDSIKDEAKRVTMKLAGVQSTYSITADDKRIMYISAKERDENQFARQDVYIKEIKPKSKLSALMDKTKIRLTKNLSVMYADLSRDAKSLALVKKAGPCDWLAVMDIAEGKPRYIFPSRTPGQKDSLGECTIYTPRFSPDGARIVFSFFDGTTRQIGIIDTAGTVFRTLYKSGFDDRDPSWSPDGEWVIFASDRTGIFNLYKKNVKTGQTIRISNVAGGAFMPEMSPDESKIAYVNYDRDGFSLYVMADTSLEIISDGSTALSETRDTLVDIVFTKNSVPYNSLPGKPLVSPIIVGEELIGEGREISSGQARWLGGAVGFLSDPIGKNSLTALFLMQLDNGLSFAGPRYKNFVNPAKDREFSLIYENKSFTPTLNFEFDLRTIHDYDRFWNEDERDSTQLDFDISLMNAAAAPRFQLTPNQKLHILADYFTGSNYFYDFPGFPKFDYLTGWRAGAMWTFLAKERNTTSEIAPQGLYLKIKIDRWNNKLMREGAFREAFYIDDDGLIKPRMDEYDFNMAKLGFKFGMKNPLYDKHVIGLQLSLAGIDRSVHGYFEIGPYLKGYPFLKNRDSLYISGDKSAELEVDYYLPVKRDIDKSISFLFIDQMYALAFFEAGGAWRTSLTGMKDNIRGSDFLKSVGAELRLECISYNNYPLAAYLRAVYGMDNPTESDRWRYAFGISFSFDNWDLIDVADYLSRNRRIR